MKHYGERVGEHPVRQLSSRFTFVHKYFVPALWIFGLGLLTYYLFLHPPTRSFNRLPGGPGSAKWVCLVAWIGTSFLVIRSARSLKHVRLQGDVLEISDYAGRHRVPLSDIVDVRPGGGRTVTIDLADPNPFHGSVRYVPNRGRRLIIWQEDEAVRELRRLAGLDPGIPAIPG